MSAFAGDGAWRAGDPVGHRQFVDVGTLTLDARGALPDVRVAYETWGTLNLARDNAVLVLHALTGDSHVAGPAGPGHLTAGWWDALVGPGRPLDTNTWFVVAPNVLGGCQGTTGPASAAPDGRAWGSRFPFVTIRDQVNAEALVADHLGIGTWAGIVGGSMGGMRVLEWAVSYPDRVASALVLASSAYASAEQIAWCQSQLLANVVTIAEKRSDVGGHDIVQVSQAIHVDFENCNAGLESSRDACRVGSYNPST